MKKIIAKYDGICGDCGNDIAAGQQAVYEKKTGIFCVGCEPTKNEDIREHRQTYIDNKVDKLRQRAQRLREKAKPKMEEFNRLRKDIAFVTQPGRFPYRDKVINRYDKGMELLRDADKLDVEADSWHKARVKGDASDRRQNERNRIKPLLKIGMEIDTAIYGVGTVKKINIKTVQMLSVRGFTVKIDISHIIL